MKPHIIRGPLAALEDRLAADVSAYRARSPLAPLTILIGSTLLRPYLRNRLAELHGSVVNLRLLTIHDLSSYLAVAAAKANGTSLLPPMGDRVIAEEVAEQAKGYFSQVAHSSGFAEALDRLFQELRQADLDSESFAQAIEQLGERIPQNAGKLTSLATLYTQAQQRRAEFHGTDDLVRLADPTRLGGTDLFVYGVWSLSTLQQRLLERLTAEVAVTFYLPEGNGEVNDAHSGLRSWLSGMGAGEESISIDSRPEATLGRLQATLFDRIDEREPAHDGNVRLVSAPDPPREIREAARACLRWAAEGIAFHEMAIAYRQPEPYRGLIDEVFGQAKIPIYLHDGRPLIERPVGRSLAVLLSLIGSRLTRASVMEFLTEARLPQTTLELYGGFEPAAWDQISREAGIVEGRGQWTREAGTLHLRLEHELRARRRVERARRQPTGRDYTLQTVHRRPVPSTRRLAGTRNLGGISNPVECAGDGLRRRRRTNHSNSLLNSTACRCLLQTSRSPVSSGRCDRRCSRSTVAHSLARLLVRSAGKASRCSMSTRCATSASDPSSCWGWKSAPSHRRRDRMRSSSTTSALR